MYQRLHQVDVSVGGGIHWRTCNLNYESAIHICNSYMDMYSSGKNHDFPKIQRYGLLIALFEYAQHLGATFYAIDASISSFIVAFLFEEKSTAESFISYCHSLNTTATPIKALFVPSNGTSNLA